MGKIITATNARQSFFNIVKETTQKHQVYHISHPSGTAVLLSAEEYDSMVETLNLLSIPGFRESIKRSVDQAEKGETFSIDEVFGDE
jgi:antitoxin YefM